MTGNSSLAALCAAGPVMESWGLFLSIVRILGVAHQKAQRRAFESEILAQTVDQIALIIVRQGIELVAEQRKGGRPRLGLGHVADAHPPSPDCGRGVAGEGAFQKT